MGRQLRRQGTANERPQGKGMTNVESKPVILATVTYFGIAMGHVRGLFRQFIIPYGAFSSP